MQRVVATVCVTARRVQFYCDSDVQLILSATQEYILVATLLLYLQVLLRLAQCTTLDTEGRGNLLLVTGMALSFIYDPKCGGSRSQNGHCTDRQPKLLFRPSVVHYKTPPSYFNV